MKINQAVKLHTHEGATAKHISIEDQLKRTLLSCLLWEKGFYESGETIVDRIKNLARQCKPEFVAKLAIQARTENKLRHAPLLLLLTLKGKVATDTIYHVINRPDELAELIALYWMNGKRPLPAAMKRGLAKAFTKFDEYQLSKWNRDGAIKLRDVMFLVHPKPGKEMESAFKKLANKTLSPPDTWESRLTGGQDKKTVFEDLLTRNKLGYMALLRNLRGMLEKGVNLELIKKRLSETKGIVLPYRFIAAAKHAPSLEPDLDKAMMKLMESQAPMTGKTILLVDVSGSMFYGKLSGKSELTYMDAACGLAILMSGICPDLRVFTFSNHAVEVAPRKGMALRDAIENSQGHGGTDLGAAVRAVDLLEYDRLIVLTDEQSHTPVPDPKGNAWMINVATNQNGVGYGAWKHIDGFSESCIEYIQQYETANY
ncbi:MAG: TROVE domain-containing protein [Betaproteobacteria bacterium]|nr:TROVE domain-containing protein [Betaproteobacteria bacterium]